VQAGDSAAKVASRHCLSLADLLRLNPAVQDPNTLAVGQALSVEARCVTSATDRAAAE
jgi:LysM repeat protein